MQRQSCLTGRVECLPRRGRNIARRRRRHRDRILRVEQRVVRNRHIVRRNHPENVPFAETVGTGRVDGVLEVVENDNRPTVRVQRDPAADHTAHTDAAVHLDYAAGTRVDPAIDGKEVAAVAARKRGGAGGREARVDRAGVRHPTAEVANGSERGVLTTLLVVGRRVSGHLVSLDGHQMGIAPGVAHRRFDARKACRSVHDRPGGLVRVRRVVGRGHPGSPEDDAQAHQVLEPGLAVHGRRKELVMRRQQHRASHGMPIPTVVHQRGGHRIPPRGVVRTTRTGTHLHPRARRVAANVCRKVGAGRKARGLVVRPGDHVQRRPHAAGIRVDRGDGVRIVDAKEAVLRLHDLTVVVDVERNELDARVDHETRVGRRVDARWLRDARGGRLRGEQEVRRRRESGQVDELRIRGECDRYDILLVPERRERRVGRVHDDPRRLHLILERGRGRRRAAVDRDRVVGEQGAIDHVAAAKYDRTAGRVLFVNTEVRELRKRLLCELEAAHIARAGAVRRLGHEAGECAVLPRRGSGRTRIQVHEHPRHGESVGAGDRCVAHDRRVAGIGQDEQPAVQLALGDPQRRLGAVAVVALTIVRVPDQRGIAGHVDRPHGERGERNGQNDRQHQRHTAPVAPAWQGTLGERERSHECLRGQ